MTGWILFMFLVGGGMVALETMFGNGPTAGVAIAFFFAFIVVCTYVVFVLIGTGEVFALQAGLLLALVCYAGAWAWRRSRINQPRR